MAIGRKVNTIGTEDFEGGCNYTTDLTSLEANESPNSMNIVFGDSVKKRQGHRQMYSNPIVANTRGHSMVDFGVVNVGRKLVTHFGNAVYKMDDLDGVQDVILANAANDVSFNTVVKQNLIQTYDDNSTEYYWNGTTSTMQILSGSAPGFKHCIEFQGYLLGGNTDSNKLRIYYEDINTMIGGTYLDYFTLTGGQDDQIEGFFLINGRCYGGTTSGIYRISYIGGVAVFEYKNVVSDVGMIPRSLQVIITKKFGQIAIFLGNDKNLYLFDGSYVQNISEKYRFPNNDTEFALDYIDGNYIRKAHSVYDTIDQVYRLFVTKKGDSRNSIVVNVDVETLAYYPFNNLEFASSVIARDNLNRRFLIGADYNGKTHKLFRNHNTDNGKVILEYYESPLIKVNGANMKKSRTMDLYFIPAANYTLRYYDRTNFDKTWKNRVDLKMFKNRDKFLGETSTLGTTFRLGSVDEVLVHNVNIPVTDNSYRFKLATTGSSDGDDCYYDEGTVSGTGGGTTVTGTGTTWTSDMTSENGYRIWIDSGDHANTSYTFDYVSATSATVGTMVAGDIVDAVYQVYKTSCASCSKGWELIKVDYNTQLFSTGRSEVQR